MKIPIFFLLFLIVFIVFIVTIAVYFQVYKRHINKVLVENASPQHSMMPPYKMAIVMTVISLIICVMISYFMGYYKAYNICEEHTNTIAPNDIQTFYAQVIEIEEHTISVEGISINEEKYQGKFSYEIWGEVFIGWNDAQIPLSELSEGDIVSITLLTDSSGLSDIFKIQLLD